MATQSNPDENRQAQLNQVVTYSETSQWFNLNPPLVATPEMAKVISVQLTKPGKFLEMKADNRYKDGNIRIVKGVVRGNKNTISLNRVNDLKPSDQEAKVRPSKSQSRGDTT